MTPERVLRLAGVPPGPVERLSGGDMGDVYRCGDVVVKTHASPPPGLFEAEARGLGQLAVAGVPVPAVRWVSDAGLVMDYLPPGRQNAPALGRIVAGLHGVGGSRYGSEGDVFLGRFCLPGGWSRDWVGFWRSHRMQPLLEATRLGRLGPRLDRLLDGYAPPVEGPVLLHGDLWGGNVHHAASGPHLIDPSAWYGERGVDLGMMQLFGGFDRAFWAAYEAVRPIPAAVRRAVPYYQLYYLVLHVHFFGDGYLSGIEGCLAELGF